MSETRAERALTDVVAVEDLAPGMARVVTVTSSHTVDARSGACTCEDHQYNIDFAAGERCKHFHSAWLQDEVTGVSFISDIR